jgi:hypothetical protein
VPQKKQAKSPVTQSVPASPKRPNSLTDAHHGHTHEVGLGSPPRKRPVRRQRRHTATAAENAFTWESRAYNPATLPRNFVLSVDAKGEFVAPLVLNLDAMQRAGYKIRNSFGFKQLFMSDRSMPVVNAILTEHGFLLFADNVIRPEFNFVGFSSDCREPLWQLINRSESQSERLVLASRYHLMLCEHIQQEIVRFDNAPELCGMSINGYREFMRRNADITIGQEARMEKVLPKERSKGGARADSVQTAVGDTPAFLTPPRATKALPDSSTKSPFCKTPYSVLSDITGKLNTIESASDSLSSQSALVSVGLYADGARENCPSKRDSGCVPFAGFDL